MLRSGGQGVGALARLTPKSKDRELIGSSNPGFPVLKSWIARQAKTGAGENGTGPLLMNSRDHGSGGGGDLSHSSRVATAPTSRIRKPEGTRATPTAPRIANTVRHNTNTTRNARRFARSFNGKLQPD
jgi:hypothetical protein